MTKLMVVFRNFVNVPEKATGIRQAPSSLTELHLKEADSTTQSSKTIHPLSLTHNDSAVDILIRLLSEKRRNYSFTPDNSKQDR